MVGVVNSEGLQKPVEGAELAEEGFPARTERGGAVGSCQNNAPHNYGNRGSCYAGSQLQSLLPCSRLVYFSCISLLNFCSGACKVFIGPILQVGNLRLRGVEELVPGH